MPEFQSIIESVVAFGNEFSFAGKSAEMMTRIAVVRFYNMSMVFSDGMS